jgi:heme exporter protein C
MKRLMKWVLPVAAVVLLGAGWYEGLAVAPPDREMGDVQRIMYVHVPLQWMAMMAMFINFVAAVAYLLSSGGNVGTVSAKPRRAGPLMSLLALVINLMAWVAHVLKSGWGLLMPGSKEDEARAKQDESGWKLDSVAEASAEIGLVLGTAGMITGSIWGRPTWGVYWSWDPRLTSEAIMLVTYMGYLVLRRFVEDPDKRATWSSAVAILGAINLPIVWFSVRWWRSLHQVQSSPRTVDPAMVLPLRISAFGMLALLLVFLGYRYRQAMAERRAEMALPDALPGDVPSSLAHNSSKVA